MSELIKFLKFHFKIIELKDQARMSITEATQSSRPATNKVKKRNSEFIFLNWILIES